MNTAITLSPKISLSDFEKIIDSGAWTHAQEIEISDQVHLKEIEYDREKREDILVDFDHTYGTATITSTYSVDDLKIEISYIEHYNYNDYQRDSLTKGTESEVWTMKGVVVVDDEGDTHDIDDLAIDFPGDFSDVDYSEIDFDKSVDVDDNDIDSEETEGMEKIIVAVDNKPDIAFVGELIARVSSSDNNASGSDYSGQSGRWTELELHRTKSGKFICSCVGKTRWQGERDKYSGRVCENEAEVIKFFGHRWLSKELYEEAGISDAEEVK